MNDPHVVALYYKIDHGNAVNYDEAEPLVVEEKAFRLEVADKKASFFLKDHYAGEREACESIERYIRDWEIDACLQHGPDSLKLNYVRAEIEDRRPTPGVVNTGVTIRAGTPKISIGAQAVALKYPSPPSDVSFNPDVRTLFDRYMHHCRGHEPLTGMAYFCFTFLNYWGEKGLNNETTGVEAAARYFRISKKVLTTVSKLCSTKGGPLGARKQVGVGQDLTNEERLFLTEAAKKIIRRAAEKAKSPTKILTQITISDLPPI